MLIKNNKIKKRNLGSEITIHRRGKSDELTNSPNTDVQIPKARQKLRANPGGAINLIGLNPSRAIKFGIGKSEFGVRLVDTTGKPLELQSLSQDRLKLLLTAISNTRKEK